MEGILSIAGHSAIPPVKTPELLAFTCQIDGRHYVDQNV
jgi:hypothetical protein